MIRSRNFIFFATTLFLGLFVTSVLADGLVTKLPKNGTWVAFKVATKIRHPDATITETTGTLTVRALKTEVIDGKKCRWLEFEHSWEDPNATKDERRYHSSAKKVAVVEADLVMGLSPETSVVQGFSSKVSSEDLPEKWFYSRVQQVRKGLGSRTGLGALDHYLHGKFHTPNPRKPRKIQVGDQILECHGVEAAESDIVKGKGKSSYAYTQWKNANAPFGVVEFAYKRRRMDGTSFDQKLTMIKSGNNAVSVLGDSQ